MFRYKVILFGLSTPNVIKSFAKTCKVQGGDPVSDSFDIYICHLISTISWQPAEK